MTFRNVFFVCLFCILMTLLVIQCQVSTVMLSTVPLSPAKWLLNLVVNYSYRLDHQQLVRR